MKIKFFVGGLLLLIALVAGYFILDDLLFDGVKPIQVQGEEFKADFYAQPGTENQTAVVLLGGGQWAGYWGVEFAKRNFVGFSLPYTNMEGLPKLPEEVPLEYFEAAVNWLAAQPEVNPDKIVIMGASRNAELALILASKLSSQITGVVAYAPSSVSWSNTVLPFSSDTIKAGWTYKGQDIPFVSMEKIEGNTSTTIKTLEYWNSGLASEEEVKKASIQVEKIGGPILLFSGRDDQVWPSAKMADLIEKRLQESDFRYTIGNFQYDNAGHLISGNPESNSEERFGTMMIDNKQYQYSYGGTTKGDFEAKQDAKNKLMKWVLEL